jgi:hypothetical protein
LESFLPLLEVLAFSSK